MAETTNSNGSNKTRVYYQDNGYSDEDGRQKVVGHVYGDEEEAKKEGRYGTRSGAVSDTTYVQHGYDQQPVRPAPGSKPKTEEEREALRKARRSDETTEMEVDSVYRPGRKSPEELQEWKKSGGKQKYEAHVWGEPSIAHDEGRWGERNDTTFIQHGPSKSQVRDIRYQQEQIQKKENQEKLKNMQRGQADNSSRQDNTSMPKGTLRRILFDENK